MRNVTADNITDVFAAYFGEEADPRTREVLVALARHIHDFARDVNLTHDEWRKGVAMLEHAGRITTPERNEFVLFSDVLGLSSLVDMLHSRPDATSSSVLGPFHVSNPPPLPIGGDMKRDFGGPVLLVDGQVRDLDGHPIAGAQIDIWQTAPNGLYSSQDPDGRWQWLICLHHGKASQLHCAVRRPRWRVTGCSRASPLATFPPSLHCNCTGF